MDNEMVDDDVRIPGDTVAEPKRYAMTVPGLVQTNLDLTNKRDMALAIAAGNPADVEIEEGQTLIFPCVKYVCFRDAVISRQSGEESEVVRTVLFGPTGETIRTTSPHAPARMQAIAALYSPEDWQKGIKIRISSRKGSKSQGYYHDIRVLYEGD